MFRRDTKHENIFFIFQGIVLDPLRNTSTQRKSENTER